MHHILRLKSPMIHRFLWLVLSMIALPHQAWAQRSDTLTVEQLVSHALAVPALTQEHDATLEEERALLSRQLTRPLPRFGIDQEYVFGSSQVAYQQVTASVSQQVDLSSWRTRMQQTLASRHAVLETTHHMREFEIAMAVRMAFYQAIYRRERVRLMSVWIAQLEQAISHLAARVGEGDVSRYELVRLERGLVHAHAQSTQEVLLYDESLGQLAMWVPDLPVKDIEGTLTPPLPIEDTPGASTPLPVQRLDELDQALRKEYEAWGTPFLRGWMLGGGYRFARVAGDPGHGFMISVEVPLVVRDIDQPQQDLLEAQRAKIGAERTLLQRQHEAQQQEARRRLEAALEGLEDLEGSSSSHLDVLALATASYQAEEISVSDLLATYQTETELELLRVDMAWEARRADLDLRRALGQGDTP